MLFWPLRDGFRPGSSRRFVCFPPRLVSCPTFIALYPVPLPSFPVEPPSYKTNSNIEDIHYIQSWSYRTHKCFGKELQSCCSKPIWFKYGARAQGLVPLFKIIFLLFSVSRFALDLLFPVLRFALDLRTSKGPLWTWHARAACASASLRCSSSPLLAQFYLFFWKEKK